MTRVQDVVLSVRAWLSDEGGSPTTPGYIDDILARTATVKQRAAWQSPWRWLIMRTTDTIRTVPRIAWPVLIAVILAALAFGVAAGPGSPQTTPSVQGKLPPLHAPAANGLIAFTAAYSNPGGTATIWVVDPDGSGRRALISSPDQFDGLTWSPDGRHLAYWDWSPGEPTGTMTLMVADADGSVSRPMFDNGDRAAPPVAWSPDSTMIAVDDGRPLSTISVIDATTGAVVLTHPGSMPAWSPDSSRLAFVNSTLQVMDLHGAVEQTLTAHVVSGPQWSPDGSGIAYGSSAGQNNSFAPNVFVVDLADGTRHDITADTKPGGAVRRGGPQWSPDGRNVLYRETGAFSNDLRGIVVTDDTDGTFTKLAIPAHGAQWSPDGLSILSSDGNGPLLISDPTGLRPQMVIDVSDLHASQFSMSWQRVAP